MRKIISLAFLAAAVLSGAATAQDRLAVPSFLESKAEIIVTEADGTPVPDLWLNETRTLKLGAGDTHLVAERDQCVSLDTLHLAEGARIVIGKHSLCFAGRRLVIGKNASIVAYPDNDRATADNGADASQAGAAGSDGQPGTRAGDVALIFSRAELAPGAGPLLINVRGQAGGAGGKGADGETGTDGAAGAPGRYMHRVGSLRPVDGGGDGGCMRNPTNGSPGSNGGSGGDGGLGGPGGDAGRVLVKLQWVSPADFVRTKVEGGSGGPGGKPGAGGAGGRGGRSGDAPGDCEAAHGGAQGAPGAAGLDRSSEYGATGRSGTVELGRF